MAQSLGKAVPGPQSGVTRKSRDGFLRKEDDLLGVEKISDKLCFELKEKFKYIFYHASWYFPKYYLSAFELTLLFSWDVLSFIFTG